MDRKKREDELETRRLISQAQAGNREAITSLYRIYKEDLTLGVMEKIGQKLGSQVESEDLTQSVWREVVKDINDFEYRGPESFYHWLITLSINKIQAKGRYFSAEKRDPNRVKPILREVSSGAGISIPVATDPTPSEAAISKERLERFMKALNRFPEIQRKVLILRMRDELDYDRISVIVGKSPGATKKLYSRSLKKLLDGMKADPGC